VKDTELEWFRPLWLRVLVTALVAAWFAWETLINRDQLWMIITGAALAYAVWNLFIAYKPPPPKKAAGGSDAGGPAADGEKSGTGTDGKPEA
jgi:hypothetical protein